MTTGLRVKSNGKAGTLRRLPVKTQLIELTGEYEGWSATMRTNPPLRVFEDLSGGDIGLMKKAVGNLILNWNFVDEEGEPMAGPHEGGMDVVPIDLLTQLVIAFTTQVQVAAGLPKA